MHLIPDTVLRAICWSLLHSLWQGFVLAAVAGTVMVLTKKASSALRYNLLCGLMFLFLLVSGYTFYHQLQQRPSEAPSSAIGATAVTINTPETQPSLTTPTPVAHPLQNGIDTLVQYFNTHASLIVLIWFMLFLAKFVQLLSGLVYTQRIRYYQTHPVSAHWQQRLLTLLARLEITRPVRLLQSGLIKTPAVI